jgi:hypothetical protein
MHQTKFRTAVTGSVLLASFLLVTTASGQTGGANSWTKPSSGFWEEPYWSLGVLPNSSQSVFITNQNWKAVGITPSTAANFPTSMTVDSLTVQGAYDTFNTLLLQYVGTGSPLRVLNGITLKDMARILNFDSALIVQGGTIIVTNAQIVQDGGLIRTTNATMYLQNADYHLTNGVFEGGQVVLGFPVSARFNQYGGTAVISQLRFGYGADFGGGTYSLYGGNLSLPNGLSIIGENNSSQSYFQAGGTNRTTSVFLEPGYYGHGPSFTLNGGLLADNDVSILADDFGSMTLNHNGGTHFITNTLSISGGSTHGQTIRPGTYSLNGGTLSAGAITLDGNSGDAVFAQSNGTTHAGTIYAQSVGYFGSFVVNVTLGGGSLSCSNFTLDDGRGSLNQSGGALTVSNLLTITGYRDLLVRYYGSYAFTGGTLTASNINIAGNWSIGDGGANRISNPGFFRLSHLLQIGNAVEQLGRFILADNATIDLAGTASRLSFANSSGQTWSGATRLIVANWNGNSAGGGAEQLKFGNNQSGLTPAQLSQILFQTGSSFYSAKILNTGEVVPDHLTGPPMTFSRQGNNFVVSWPSGWILQSATNVAGPYSDVSGATSPYQYNTTQSPQQFFRLRQ